MPFMKQSSLPVTLGTEWGAETAEGQREVGGEAQELLHILLSFPGVKKKRWDQNR